MRRSAGITRRRLLVALWLVATVLAVAVVLGATRLLGHTNHSARTAVAQYITSADGVQQRMRLQLTQLLSAYRAFSTTGTSPAAAAKRSAAEETLRTLADRLAALPGPAAAAKLRRLLLALVREEIAVAHELNDLASFMPRFHELLATVKVANTKLGRDLAASAPPKPQTIRGTAKQIAKAQAEYAAQATQAARAQADAVDAYDSALGRIVLALRRVRPPAVMTPAYRTELRTLTATKAAGAALAAELRKPDRSQVPKRSRALTEAARISGSVAAQRAEIAAVKAYNARVRTIGKAQARVQAEVRRLQRELG
jgi:hypothetical protein